MTRISDATLAAGIVVITVSSLAGCRRQAQRREAPVPATSGGTHARGAGTEAGGGANQAARPSAGPLVPLPGGGWVRRIGGPEDDVGADVALAPGGELVVTGYVGGPAEAGGPALPHAGGDDLLVASYDAAGAHRWSRSVGGGESDRGEAVSVDGGGRVLVLGYVSGGMSLGGGLSITGTGQRGLVVGLSAAGEPEWSQELPGTTTWPQDLVALPAGDLVALGAFEQPSTIGGRELRSAGGSDVFVTRLAGDRSPRWSMSFGGSGDDGSSAATFDGAGNLYVVGSFAGTLTIGPHSVESAGEADLFVASFSPAGEIRWLHRFGGEAWDEGYAVAVDRAGHVYAAGLVRRAGFYHGGRPTTYDDLFVASLTAEGQERWAHRFETTAGAFHALASNPTGGVCAAGSFSGGVSIGDERHSSHEGEELASIPGGGEPHGDVLVACFTDAGERSWSRSFGGNDSDGAYGLAVGPDGSAYVAGWITGRVDLGGPALASSGGSDILLARLLPSR